MCRARAARPSPRALSTATLRSDSLLPQARLAMPTTEPTLGCDCGWTSNAEACSESDNSYCWNACCLYPAPESGWPDYYDQLEPGRNSQEACDEALGVGLGIGLAGGLVFALVILLGYRKAPGGSEEVVVLERRPAEAVRLIWALGASSLVGLLANLINDNYTCRKSGAYGLAACGVTLIAAIALLVLDRHPIPIPIPIPIPSPSPSPKPSPNPKPNANQVLDKYAPHALHAEVAQSPPSPATSAQCANAPMRQCANAPIRLAF